MMLTEVERVLLRQTAQTLDTAAEAITDKLEMSYVPRADRGQRRLVERRAKLYRLSYDLRQFAEDGTWS